MISYDINLHRLIIWNSIRALLCSPTKKSLIFGYHIICLSHPEIYFIFIDSFYSFCIRHRIYIALIINQSYTGSNIIYNSIMYDTDDAKLYKTFLNA
jgi:hypothetical protein